MKDHQVVTCPKILIVMIKRFVYFPQPQKLSNKIELAGDQLSLEPFMLKSREKTPSKGLPGSPLKGQYKLKSFIEHFGHINGGHYVAYGLSEKADKWVLFNDSQTRPLNSDKMIMDCGGYVYSLFYELV